ncbi:MAG: hypothetical protein J2P36_22425 [Ktedonobacteraceae bacterium]|nr:hypothetical protein [Ktedonobacteraceae bacterium]
MLRHDTLKLIDGTGPTTLAQDQTAASEPGVNRKEPERKKIQKEIMAIVNDPRLQPGACIWTPPQLSIPSQACCFGFAVRGIRGD